MKFSAISKLLSVSALAIAIPSLAHAAVVYDAITVYDSLGGILGSVSATEAEIIANPNAIFYVPGIAVDTSLFGGYGVVLDGGVAVDIFGIATGGPEQYDLAFSPGGQAQTYPIQNPVLATGLPIDLTKYLDPSLQALGDTAFFTATGLITIPGAPEPTTWAMMMVGLGMVGGAMRYKRRVSVNYSFG
jgi:PEP-CTERM motif